MSGESPEKVLAELLGKETGCSGGKGGSMHMFCPEGGFYGGHGIVAAQVPVGTGIAFANHYRRNKNLCVTFLGDGAVNQGQVFESFNMAALWKLPVIYVVENNMYAMGTSVDRSTVAGDLFRRGEVFGIPGVAVDGMDILAVRCAAKEAVKYVRDGNGPYIMEMKTYRYRGHSMSDPAQYRTRSEVTDMRKNNDPIMRLQHFMMSQGLADECEFSKISDKISDIMSAAEEYAQDSSYPSCDVLSDNVYRAE